MAVDEAPVHLRDPLQDLEEAPTIRRLLLLREQLVRIARVEQVMMGDDPSAKVELLETRLRELDTLDL